MSDCQQRLRPREEPQRSKRRPTPRTTTSGPPRTGHFVVDVTAQEEQNLVPDLLVRPAVNLIIDERSDRTQQNTRPDPNDEFEGLAVQSVIDLGAEQAAASVPGISVLDVDRDRVEIPQVQQYAAVRGAASGQVVG